MREYFKTEEGIILHNTKWEKPIPHKKKMTFNRFMHMIWACSHTNLHYLDFKELFEKDMDRMFRPVKGKVADGRECFLRSMLPVMWLILL